MYRILAVSYVGLGDYHRAIEFAEKGMRIAREMGDRGAEGHVYRILAGSYVGLGDYHRGIEYAKEGLRIARQVGDRGAIHLRLKKQPSRWFLLVETFPWLLLNSLRDTDEYSTKKSVPITFLFGQL